jgi:hypothetical protein
MSYLDLSNNWSGTNLTWWGNRVVNGTNGTKTSSMASVFTSLSSKCSGVDTCNIINNGQFDEGTRFWQLQFSSGGNGTYNVVNFGNLSGVNSLRVCPTSPGTADWHVQVNQNTPIQAGTTYYISFMARADVPRSMGVVIQQEGGSWSIYYNNTVNLLTSKQSFSFIFTPTVTDPTAKFRFLVGNNSTCVYIDSVIFRECVFPLSINNKNIKEEIHSNQINWNSGLWSLSPNPFYEYTQLRWSGEEGFYKIIDLTGRVIESGQLSEVKNLGEELQKGIYLLLILETNHQEIIKLIKK